MTRVMDLAAGVHAATGIIIFPKRLCLAEVTHLVDHHFFFL